MPYCEQLRELFTTYGRCLFTGCMLMVIQQMCGFSFLLYYGPLLIKQVNFFGLDNKTEYSSLQVSLILNLAFVNSRIMGNVIALYVIDRRGRRTILVKTLPVLLFFMVLVCASTGFLNYTDNRNRDVDFKYKLLHKICKWFAFMGIMMFMLVFETALGTVPWLVNSEIYPINMIGTATGIAAFVYWFLMFLQLSSYVNTSDKEYIVFVISCCFLVLGELFVFYFLKETQGNSIQKNIALILKKTQTEVSKKMAKKDIKKEEVFEKDRFGSDETIKSLEAQSD